MNLNKFESTHTCLHWHFSYFRYKFRMLVELFMMVNGQWGSNHQKYLHFNTVPRCSFWMRNILFWSQSPLARSIHDNRNASALIHLWNYFPLKWFFFLLDCSAPCSKLLTMMQTKSPFLHPKLHWKNLVPFVFSSDNRAVPFWKRLMFTEYVDKIVWCE